MSDETPAPDIAEFCHDCGAHYTQDHGIGCAVVARQLVVDRMHEARLEAEKLAMGEKIAEDGDGVYVEHPDEPAPVLTLYNQGGHDCASVYISKVVEWVKRRRPDLL